MIEELLHWPIKNKNLEALGRKIEQLNKEFCLLDISLSAGIEDGMANMHRARSVSKKIDNLIDKTYRLKPKSRYDQLVLTNYRDSLFAQQEYTQFFFTKKYNKEWGMREFLNYLFLPEEEFRGKHENNGAMAILEDKLRNINYSMQTKRENLMQDIYFYPAVGNPEEFSDMVLDQIPRLRKMVADYDIEMGFETPEQVEIQDFILKKKELVNAQDRLKRILGPSMDGIFDLIKTQTNKSNKNLLGRSVEITEELNNLIYDFVYNDEDYCAYDHGVRAMEVNTSRFYFYQDKKTRKNKIYTGDIDRCTGHENYHRLQALFSRFMPPGLKETPGELDIRGRTIAEGVAATLETNFMGWLDKNKRKYNISKNDFKIASLYEHEYYGNRTIRLCHALYHRELVVEAGKRDYDAHLKLAEVSKVPVLGDDEYLGDESVAEVFYYSLYIFGKRNVKDTLDELEKREIKRQGTIRKARNFLKKNEPVVLQGLLTGNWGWSTHKDFFLNHYWPKARKYCE